jgi:hypothetical protein
MGMAEVRRQREHLGTDSVAVAARRLQSASGKTVTQVVNARSSGAVRQSGRLQELPE